MPDKGTIPMGFRPGELWVMGYWRIMGFPPYTNSGMAKSYGVSEVMGYQEHGLRGCRLYAVQTRILAMFASWLSHARSSARE
ncbi:hypothetical protein K466DRAFT_20091 [Polyporus arcularius HHB13444]|uniref:Uncharacterized protein n=1 Tax=Polyporus arcularius HHB13444 TaxID=1314778 RepID=A0A5C3NPY5_9APHY|nr:hypothetical protein K466DRAFT_20091 [Polyporus arcularius HHB13444]